VDTAFEAFPQGSSYHAMQVHQSSAVGSRGRSDSLVRISRPRLDGRLCSADASQIAVLIGPAGTGKSELLRRYRNDPNVLYFRAGNEHATFARFVQGIARSVSRVAPGAAASFPRAWEQALQSRCAGTVLAHWLAEHLHGIDHRLVVDDLHDGAADSNVAAFIAGLAELRPDAGLTLALRDPGKLPIALWMATQRLDRPIDERELAFDAAEIATAAAFFGVRCPSVRFAVPAVTVIYAMARAHSDSGEAARLPAGSFDAIARSIYGRRSGRERAFLFSAALLPTMDDELLRLCGWDDADEIRDALGSDAAFIWEREENGEIRFFDRFRDYLAAQFATTDDDFRAKLARSTVRALTAAGQYGDALSVATHHHLAPAIAELLEGHGFALLEAGSVDAIAEALEAFATPGQALSGRAMALRGYLDARSGRLDTSEAWFRLAIERAEDEASRVAIAMYYAHELALRRRVDSGDALAPFVDSTTLPRDLRIDVRSSYAQALTAANRVQEAGDMTDAVLALLTDDAPIALRARVYARAAYVALECGLPGVARERALIAAPLAVSAALYDVAASTYSVLYNVAYEIDDDAVAALEYLQRLRDLAVKSGTLRLDLYALIGIYHLQAEAGNDAALFELESEITAADKHDSTSEIVEALVPARALQAAWNARFHDALRLLRPTLDHQASVERRALCLAHVALYSAAAGDIEAADCAVNAAADALDAVESPTIRFERTQLILALATLVAGDLVGVKLWLDEADQCAHRSAPRLRILRDTLAVLLAARDDPDRFERDMTAALQRLHNVAYGGMARLIEALPDRLTGSSETVASRLTRREFARRFEAAVDAVDIAPLTDWLTNGRNALFTEVSLVERFERWSAAQAGCDAQRHAAMLAVRAQIAAFRPPVPAYVRLGDDIDATIEELFGHLSEAAPLMAEHSRAVSAWCSRIARAFGLSQRDSEFVTRGGLVHDVGKIWTPAEILNAPRGLTPREWEIMRDHAPAGAWAVGEKAMLRPFVPIVRGHHERLDGAGYPDGLRGSAIPLAARIVSVADSFNAMIGRRPYRLPMAPTDALAELERHRGTQFDPEVVDAMIRIVQGRLVDE
jgi:HD-GYP domain-containing protein (c-di-GMP phosphodiesterase class II)